MAKSYFEQLPDVVKKELTNHRTSVRSGDDYEQGTNRDRVLDVYDAFLALLDAYDKQEDEITARYMKAAENTDTFRPFFDQWRRDQENVAEPVVEKVVPMSKRAPSRKTE